MAALDPLLAHIELKPLVARVAEAHSPQAVASGTVCWDDTGDLMVPPSGQAMVEHEDAVRQIVAGSRHAMAAAAHPPHVVSTAQPFQGGESCPAYACTEQVVLQRILQAWAIAKTVATVVETTV